MIFNAIKNNNRVFLDIGDINNYLLRAMITCNKTLDRTTVFAIATFLNYICKKYDDKRFKNGSVVQVDLNNKRLDFKLNTLLWKNNDNKLPGDQKPLDDAGFVDNADILEELLKPVNNQLSEILTKISDILTKISDIELANQSDD